MENKKNYKPIIIGIIIFFAVVIIAFVIVYFSYSKTLNKENSNVDNKNSSNNAQEETMNTKLTTEQKKALVVDAMNVNESKGKCQQGDCDLYLKAVLPKINLNTPTVDGINKKINDIYTDATNYYNQDFSTKTGKDGKYISYDISYKSSYIEKYDCIVIDITNGQIHTHASGSSEHIRICYLVDEDKEISIDELLKKYNITLKDLGISLSSNEKKALLVDAMDVNESKGKCQQGDCDLYLKAVLPKINLNTPTVNSINKKINDIYTDATNYYNQDFSNKTGKDGKYISYDISYRGCYIEDLDCIYINITIGYVHTHASGSSEHKEIVYLVDEDKEMSVDDFIKQKNISKEYLQSFA